MAGKDAGHRGRVVKVLRDKAQVVVQGANIVRRHKKTGWAHQGVVVDMEKGMDVADVSLIDPTDGLPTPAVYSTPPSDGAAPRARVRVSTRTGAAIPKPAPVARERQGKGRPWSWS